MHQKVKVKDSFEDRVKIACLNYMYETVRESWNAQSCKDNIKH